MGKDTPTKKDNVEDDGGFFMENVKLAFDHTKLICTLSSGSILVIVTFYDKLAKEHSCKVLIATSMLCFVCAIVCGIGHQGLVLISNGDADSDQKVKTLNILLNISLVGGWISFCAGLLFLTAYGIVNL